MAGMTVPLPDAQRRRVRLGAHVEAGAPHAKEET